MVGVRAEEGLLVAMNFPADELDRGLLRFGHMNNVIGQRQVAKIRVETCRFPSKRGARENVLQGGEMRKREGVQPLRCVSLP